MNKDEKIQKLEEENNKLKEQLNKYLLKNKTYYENHSLVFTRKSCSVN